MATDYNPIETLSEREMAVLGLMARGKSNPEIAAELGIRFETAKWYVSEVLQKLQVPSREAAAVQYRRYNRASARLARAIAGVPLLLRWGGAASVIAVTAIVVFALAAPGSRKAQEAQWLIAYVEGDEVGEEPGPAPIRIVDMKTRDEWDLGPPDLWGAVAWSPTGDRLLALRRSGELALLSYPDGDLLDYDAPEPDASFRLYEASWSPDGRRFFVAGSMFDKDGHLLWAGNQRLQYAMWAPDGEHLALAVADGLEIVRAEDGTVVFGGAARPSNWLSRTELGALADNPDLSFGERARIVDLAASPPQIVTPAPSFDTDQLLGGQLPGIDRRAAEDLLETVSGGESVGIVLGGASLGTALTVVGELAERLGAPPNPVAILVTDGEEAFRVDVEPRWSIPGVQGEWGQRASFVIRH
jgi:DNA-binding CsgD family transcriptional regulator